MTPIGIEYSLGALLDLEQIAHYLHQRSPDLAPRGIELIAHAIDALSDHPRIGRPTRHGLRELVISRGLTGFVALYRYDEGLSRGLVLALRGQREAGFEFD